MEKVSIIMPVYNCEKYLDHTVQSVINQTYPNWELLIIDDASTDRSLEKACEYMHKDKRIHVSYYLNNQGVSACRNSGLKSATGDYVAFLDADDLWSDDKLEKQLAFMKEKDANFSHTSYGFINAEGDVMDIGQFNVKEELKLKEYMKTTQIDTSTVMYNRKRIPDLQFPKDRKLCEDSRVWMHYMRKGEQFYGLNEILTLYRVRPGQLSGNKFKMATSRLKFYIKEKNLPAYKKLFYFLNYAYNGVKKRRIKNNLNMPEIYQHFNCHKK